MENHTKYLIIDIQNGNEEACKELYEIYADYALRTVYLMTFNRNHTADIVQEAFIKVLKNIGNFNLNKPFKPWLYTILYNESMRYMKKQNKEPVAMASEQLLYHLNETPAQFEDHMTSENIIDAFKKLKENHRIVILLKYIQGFSEKEIAEILSLNVNTVKSRLFKARKKLRTKMGGDPHEREV